MTQFFVPNLRSMHLLYEEYEDCKQAIINFENGYGASVLIGNLFYSNGVDTYELAVLHEGSITYNTDITDDVLSYITKDEVTEAMKKIQELK